MLSRRAGPVNLFSGKTGEMCEKRKDLTPLGEAFANMIVEIVRFGLGRIEPAELTVGPIQPGLLTRKEAAEFLGISLSTLDELRKTGKLKPIEIHGLIRYRRADLVRYANKLPYAPATAPPL